MTTPRQTVAGAYDKINSHERECALRYKALEDGIGDVKNGVKWLIGLVCSVATVLIVTLAGVSWSYVQRDLASAHASARHSQSIP